MAIIDEETHLSPARLQADATAIGQAMLEADWEEARFRAHLLRSHADDLGLTEVANSALRVVLLMPSDHGRPAQGIGVAMLRLFDALGPRR